VVASLSVRLSEFTGNGLLLGQRRSVPRVLARGVGSHLRAGETVLNREYYCRFSGFGWPNVALQSTFSFSTGGVRCRLVRRLVRRTCSGAKLNATELGR
jgi:hypothetical protein